MNPPLVSVVVPMRNEQTAIEACVKGFDVQDHPHDALEVIVVDGCSDDGSRELVAELAESRPWLRVIDNPDVKASAAFNRGIEAASGDYIAIVSSHGAVGRSFVSRSIEVLEATGAAGVGGRLDHVGHDPRGRAIGLAMTSRFGMASPFRYANTPREVDTIGHPVYRASVLEEVGPFDEHLDRNSDYELNQRIRNAGHLLMFEPSIVTTYYPRAALAELARQFWDYGRWKGQIVAAEPSNLRWRHAVPPALVVAGFGLLLASKRSGRARVALSSAVVGYGGMLSAAFAESRPREASADPGVFLAAFPVMHLPWALGFLVGLVRTRS